MDSSQPPTSDERTQLNELREALYEPWGLADVKTTTNPRIGFVALANWIDTVARLSTGRTKTGENAWKHFVGAYFPRPLTEDAVRLLYVGLRNKLSHEYGTRGVGLIDGRPDEHFTEQDGLLLLNLESLISEFGQAFQAFYGRLERDADLRARVLPHVAGLLALVEIGGPAASASQSETVVRLTGGAIAASATGPPEWTRRPRT
jgi:hypothetical protein